MINSQRTNDLMPPTTSVLCACWKQGTIMRLCWPDPALLGAGTPSQSVLPWQDPVLTHFTRFIFYPRRKLKVVDPGSLYWLMMCIITQLYRSNMDCKLSGRGMYSANT